MRSSAACSVPGCRQPYRAKGYCARHYQRLRDYGRLDRVADWAVTEYQRFWKYVVLDEALGDGCWLWRGSLVQNGYGIFSYYRLGQKTSKRAHRFAYEALVGPIPEGLTLDHLCRVRRCVNPAHLEPVTIGDNIRRGVLARAQARAEDLVKLTNGVRV